MADDDRDLTLLVTRGLAGLSDQLREREDRYARLSENMIRMEGDLKAINTTVGRIEAELSKAETSSLTNRVSNLELANVELKKKQDTNATRIWGLIAGTIILVVAVIIQFIAARFK